LGRFFGIEDGEEGVWDGVCGVILFWGFGLVFGYGFVIGDWCFNEVVKTHF
jgi:hypothetical protein